MAGKNVRARMGDIHLVEYAAKLSEKRVERFQLHQVTIMTQLLP